MTAPAIASKPVSITFPSGKFLLDENAKTIIDIQFAELAKTFANVKVRVEGNTDNVGSAASNKVLSEKEQNLWPITLRLNMVWMPIGLL